MGRTELTRVLGSRIEYLPTARNVEDVPAMLANFTERIPYRSPDNWPVHVAGHPPGALLFFVLLARVGLGGDLAAALVVVLIAATIPLAVMSTLRLLGSETTARRAAPFLTLTPAAIFMAVSADAVFAAVGCWATAALAAATVADRGAHPSRGRMVGWAALAGLLFGYGVFMQYGFGLLAPVALAVLVAQRSWRPVLVLVPVALALTGVFALYGFAWWEAYPVLVERYWAGLASDRPMSYWWWGNLAALLVSAGPMVGAGLGHAARLAVARPTREIAVPLGLVGGVALAIIAAEVSGMSKSEVERIWLIFIPWLTVSLALLPARWLRWALGAQLVTALVVQHLLYTSW